MNRGAVLGLDIGESKTPAVLGDAGGPIPELVEASANVASVGADQAHRVLARIARTAGADVERGCAGAAGADTPASKEVLAGRLARQFPAAQIEVVHDARLILAAAGLDAGAVLIAGTGSVAWGMTPDGREARCGGGGGFLGGEGRGYAVGRDAVREALREYDAGLPPGTLASVLLGATACTGVQEMLDLFYTRPERRYWSALAEVVAGVAAEGDRAASRILSEAAHALASLARQVIGRLGTELPLILAGGLLVN